MAYLCETLGCLPRPGGLLDQDSYHIYLIHSVLAARAEVEREQERKRRQNGS